MILKNMAQGSKSIAMQTSSYIAIAKNENKSLMDQSSRVISYRMRIKILKDLLTATNYS